MEIRTEVWRRLATDMKPHGLSAITREISLDGLNDAFATLLAGRAQGRFVVNLGT
jgi:D-arabinose 1-dehydrogenase-like Zn-dependent alcohol dehydrogenase